MATSNRGGNRSRTGKNNNPAGHNQYDRGWVDSARDRPFTAAVAAAATVGAGVFLWSRRNQISDQLSTLSDQIAEWREGIQSDDAAFFGDEAAFEQASDKPFLAAPSGKAAKRSGKKSQRDISQEALTLKETGRDSARPADPVVNEQTKVGSVAY